MKQYKRQQEVLDDLSHTRIVVAPRFTGKTTLGCFATHLSSLTYWVCPQNMARRTRERFWDVYSPTVEFIGRYIHGLSQAPFMVVDEMDFMEDYDITYLLNLRNPKLVLTTPRHSIMKTPLQMWIKAHQDDPEVKVFRWKADWNREYPRNGRTFVTEHLGLWLDEVYEFNDL